MNPEEKYNEARLLRTRRAAEDFLKCAKEYNLLIDLDKGCVAKGFDAYKAMRKAWVAFLKASKT